MSNARTVTRTLLALTGATGLVLAASACNLIKWNTLQDGLRENTEITAVTIDVDSGNVTVYGDGTAGVDVRRTVRYADNHAPGQTMKVTGSTLSLTQCGNMCSASYEVHVARGVKVTGSTDSGNADLRGVSDVDVHVDSGNVTVDGATGSVTLEADSGNVEVRDVAGAVRAKADSGNVTATGARSTVDLEANSGNITATLPGTASLTAKVDSGDITVRVPDNCCRVEASADSGDERVTIGQNMNSSTVLRLTASSGNITVRPT